MKRDIALVMLGIIIGAVAMNAYLADRLDDLYITRNKLRVELYETSERLKKIEAQWRSHRTTVIHEVEIEFAKQTPDPFLEVALRQQVLKLVQDLVGEEVDKISPALTVHLLDQRIVEADGKRYRLYVRTVILAEKLTYILSYEPVSQQADDEP